MRMRSRFRLRCDIPRSYRKPSSSYPAVSLLRRMRVLLIFSANYSIVVSLAESYAFVKRLCGVLHRLIRPDIHLFLHKIERTRPQVEIRLEKIA